MMVLSVFSPALLQQRRSSRTTATPGKGKEPAWHRRRRARRHVARVLERQRKARDRLLSHHSAYMQGREWSCKCGRTNIPWSTTLCRCGLSWQQQGNGGRSSSRARTPTRQKKIAPWQTEILKASNGMGRELDMEIRQLISKTPPALPQNAEQHDCFEKPTRDEKLHKEFRDKVRRTCTD